MKKVILLFLTLCIIFSLSACSMEDFEAYLPVENTEGKLVPSQKGELRVTALDVEQGDCILINLPDGKTCVIDSGEEKYVCDKLRDYGVTAIDYLVATHPHSDHIGRMADMVRQFDIGEIYMPRASNDTKQYAYLLEAIKEKGKTVKTAKAGVIMAEGDGYRAEFVAPNSDSYEELNDYSAVLHLTYGERTFIFMGDAEMLSEYEIMDNYPNLKADVLKVGHHGSSTSSCEEFIDMLEPEIALISCGEDNSYGHPHWETMETLDGMNILRTDEMGDVTVICDGYELYTTHETVMEE